ncbi:MAG: histidine phosphatase family protein [Gammaproteobacteria bacterium]|nr:histidine phosphatase family protein [Gammaproteobacteria bacterium]
MPQLYLIRHGQSENNARAGESPRTADPGLTHTGQVQAVRVASHLTREADRTDVRDGFIGEGGYRIGRLICSPMLRALQTALPIGEALGLSPQVWVDTHEGGGVWLDREDGRGRVGHGGLTRAEMETRFPGFDIPDAVTGDGWWNGTFELREQLVARAARVACDIRDLMPRAAGRIAMVSHGTFLNLLVQHLVFGTHVPGCRLSSHNTAISRLDFEGDRLVVRYLNRVDHLDDDLVT